MSLLTVGSSWNPAYYHRNIKIAMLNLDQPDVTTNSYTLAFNEAISLRNMSNGFTYHVGW